MNAAVCMDCNPFPFDTTDRRGRVLACIGDLEIEGLAPFAKCHSNHCQKAVEVFHEAGLV